MTSLGMVVVLCSFMFVFGIAFILDLLEKILLELKGLNKKLGKD